MVMFTRLAPPLRRTLGSSRSLATRRKMKSHLLPQEVLEKLPVFQDDPEDDTTPRDPAFYRRSPVTSAHCIDVNKKEVSNLDSVAISPGGTVVHARYGDLGAAAEAIPLEYLALLRPAAEGAAALRVTLSKSKHSGRGTLLVYGASQASGLAAAQLAVSAGHAVVGVVDSQHSGNDTMMEALKEHFIEPGTAVPEEYALSKGRFANLVQSISSGDEGIATPTAEEYLQEFKANLLDYVQVFPDTRPAAVSEENLEFKYMDKDREMFDINMEAYLEQFPPGSPPIDPAKLDAFFTTEQYEIFRQKFWQQTTRVISGENTPFSAPHIAKSLSESPETLDHRTYPGSGPEVQYSFSILKQQFPAGTEVAAGGPILGAIVVATPHLVKTAARVSAAKTLRGRAEALQFVTQAERASYLAACSVVAQARKAGAPVVTIGSLPEMDTVAGEPTPADVKQVLAAMDVDERGQSKLNYFVQVYRANDFEFYADYAVHRACEVLAGPRQFIVTK